MTNITRPRDVTDELRAGATAPPIRLAETLDRKLIQSVYARTGRIHIRPVFTPDAAAALYRCLTTEIPWQFHFNNGEQFVDLSAAQFEALAEADRARFLKAVYESAGRRFQFLYCNYPVSDLYATGEYRWLYVMRLYEFLNSPEFLGFAREVVGVPSIAFADAQATLYRPGHFLTQHDDLVPDKKRVAAYVLSFTPRWLADWGGILQFIADDGHLAEGFAPGFNALNLFKVPQPHAVSYVTPFAQAGRYSITGWLREA
jgi:Rps23 Pro-64 3,4-dihydroxylase Tpa1-like proline 4-hydroxylase